MAITIRCGKCGKRLPLPEGGAGQMALCPACGARAALPPAKAFGWSPGTNAAPPAPTSSGTSVAPPSSPPFDPVPWIVGAVLACIAGLGLVLWLTLHAATPPSAGPVAQAPTWEQANRPTLLAMKADAESLALSGKLREAHEKYRQLQDLAAGHELADPALKEQLDRAGADQARLYSILLEANRQPHASTPAAPPVAIAPEPATRPAPTPAAVPQPAPAVAVAPVPAPPPASPVAPPAAQPPSPATAPLEAFALPPRPAARPMRGRRELVTDEEIGRAIQRGANYLSGEFRNSELATVGGGQHVGANALAVYALLMCGQTIDDQRLNIHNAFMRGLMNRMKQMPVQQFNTYTCGIRATALAVYARPEDREALRADVAWLIAAAHKGAYTYSAARNYGFNAWDNSNSQYGLLGVWSGAEAGCEVPDEYWREVEYHWTDCQLASGEWGYGDRAGATFTMTCAGIASLFVTHDYLEAPTTGTMVGRDPFSSPLARGLAWLETEDNCLGVVGSRSGYALYGLERVGLASGFKYFGVHDWYRELARKVVDGQWPNGSFGDVVNTSYALLFLARGRHPIIMNKLRFDGFWANRPRDVANLGRFASRELERPLNWQVVPIDRDWTDWADSPILYLASHQPPKLKIDDYRKLRDFVESGGLLFTQCDGERNDAFNDFAEKLARTLFPGYEMRDVPEDHELYSLNYNVDPRPPLRYVSNGSRILMVHSPTDIAMHWQMRKDKTQRHAFQLGANLFLYAAGKANLRNRLDSPWLPPPAARPAGSIPLARLRYGGNWDPEPQAFVRYPRWLQEETGLGLDVQNVDLDGLTPAAAPIAHLTGNVRYTFSPQQAKSLRRYVEAGGVLLIDACGGSGAFHDSIKGLLTAAFPDTKLQPLPPAHPLLTAAAAGMEDLSKPRLRPYTTQKLGPNWAGLEMLRCGKGCVLYSSLDITTGLLGANTHLMLGYQPAYAQSLVKNVLIWTWDGAKQD